MHSESFQLLQSFVASERASENVNFYTSCELFDDMCKVLLKKSMTSAKSSKKMSFRSSNSDASLKLIDNNLASAHSASGSRSASAYSAMSDGSAVPSRDQKTPSPVGTASATVTHRSEAELALLYKSEKASVVDSFAVALEVNTPVSNNVVVSTAPRDFGLLKPANRLEPIGIAPRVGQLPPIQSSRFVPVAGVVVPSPELTQEPIRLQEPISALIPLIVTSDATTATAAITAIHSNSDSDIVSKDPSIPDLASNSGQSIDSFPVSVVNQTSDSLTVSVSPRLDTAPIVPILPKFGGSPTIPNISIAIDSGRNTNREGVSPVSTPKYSWRATSMKYYRQQSMRGPSPRQPETARRTKTIADMGSMQPFHVPQSESKDLTAIGESLEARDHLTVLPSLASLPVVVAERTSPRSRSFHSHHTLSSSVISEGNEMYSDSEALLSNNRDEVTSVSSGTAHSVSSGVGKAAVMRTHSARMHKLHQTGNDLDVNVVASHIRGVKDYLQGIVDKHVVTGAPEEINIPGTMRDDFLVRFAAWDAKTKYLISCAASFGIRSIEKDIMKYRIEESRAIREAQMLVLDAKTEIYNLLKKDTFPRFKRTKEFRDFVARLKPFEKQEPVTRNEYITKKRTASSRNF